jgi:Ca2+-binding EF-hand superfamily protein
MEIYNIFKKLGADVSENDIIELMTEIDVDRNGELDIDEFISIMTVGD